MTDLALAVLLGTAFGAGICLTVSIAPRWGAPSLARRIGPYIREVTDPGGTTGIPVSGRGAGAVWGDLQRRFARLTGAAPSVERRLRHAGWVMDAGAFRGRQLTWTAIGVGVGGILVTALAVTGRGGAAMWMLPPVAGATGAFACGAMLTRAARARVARIEEELPTLLEFLALCLSAGEGMLDSLRRVGAVGASDLTGEIRTVVLAVGTGSPLGESLSLLARRLEVPALSRSIDHLVAAIDRGGPLAHVLHAQALDAREDAKRGLLERAGRKEIAMMLPLVFLILPLSVLFAVFPGIFMLRLGIG
ncbi:type II secretion system F family protein [Planococcus sp. APC 4015]|nr:type II secretion system F family protein [Planococcus sp. APC 4015]